MSKTQKELAFLRDLYIANDWTLRFAEIFDKNFKFSDEKTVLYVNAGTGNHALELREKLAIDCELNAFSDDEELNIIAQAKADALHTKVDFSGDFPNEKFDAVIADASFVRRSELEEFLDEIIDLSNKQVIFFLPTAGSFGEIFSFLWEALFDLDLLEKSAEIERLIAEIPTVEKVKEIAEYLGPMFSNGLPVWQRMAVTMAWPKIVTVMIKGMDLGPAQGLESRAIVERELAWLDGLLADGRPYLTGNQFTRADITAASLLAPLVGPKEHPTYAAAVYPAVVAATMRAWAERPILRMVREVYASRR